MEYEWYKPRQNDYLMHAAKGSSWANHKYISKKYVNGVWRYIYNTLNKGTNTASNNSGYKWYQLPNGKRVYAKAGSDGYVKGMDQLVLNGKNAGSYSNIKSNKTGGYGTMSYDKRDTKTGKKTSHTETTVRGDKWLTRKSTMTWSDGSTDTTVYKGKLAQKIEDTANKGKNWLSNMSKKKKKK